MNFHMFGKNECLISYYIRNWSIDTLVWSAGGEVRSGGIDNAHCTMYGIV